MIWAAVHIHFHFSLHPRPRKWTDYIRRILENQEKKWAFWKHARHHSCSSGETPGARWDWRGFPSVPGRAERQPAVHRSAVTVTTSNVSSKPQRMDILKLKTPQTRQKPYQTICIIQQLLFNYNRNDCVTVSPQRKCLLYDFSFISNLNPCSDAVYWVTMKLQEMKAALSVPHLKTIMSHNRKITFTAKKL